MITLKNVSKVYGKTVVLDSISQCFEEGRIYGLVGPNGCGKTTLMRCICGFTHVTSGSVSVDGKVVGKDCDFAPATGIKSIVNQSRHYQYGY